MPCGTIGTPPACRPPGTNYKNGVCVRPAPKEEPKPQNVECPEGSIKIAGICLKIPKKKDKPNKQPGPEQTTGSQAIGRGLAATTEDTERAGHCT
ncbi:MAG: hypothetical protein IPL91_14880 [Hyphomicrobium sp.]|nr:hypothetical protein [Hyphomicrobium sp.]